MRKFFAVVFAIAFVSGFGMTVWMHAGTKLLSPDFYLEAFEEANFYESALKVADVFLANSPDLQQFVGFLEPEDLVQIRQKAIDAEWLETQVEGLLTETSEAEKGRRSISDLSLVIDLESRKNLLSEELKVVAKPRIEELPTCTEEDMEKILSDEFTAQDTCIPEDMTTEEFYDELVAPFVTELPDEVDLLASTDGVAGSNASGAMSFLSFISFIKVIKLLVWVCWFFTVLNLLWIFLLTKRDGGRSVLRWLSIPMFIAGVLTLLGVLINQLSLSSQVYFTEIPIGLTLADLDPITEVIRAILSQLQFIPLVAGAVVTVLAIIVFVLSFVINRKKVKAPGSGSNPPKANSPKKT